MNGADIRSYLLEESIARVESRRRGLEQATGVAPLDRSRIIHWDFGRQVEGVYRDGWQEGDDGEMHFVDVPEDELLLASTASWRSKA